MKFAIRGRRALFGLFFTLGKSPLPVGEHAISESNSTASSSLSLSSEDRLKKKKEKKL